MAVPRSTSLALCVLQARNDPAFAVDVRATAGKDLDVFVKHLEDKLWCDSGPNRRMMSIAKEHGIPRDLLDGSGDCFDWSDVFPLSVRTAAYTSMCSMHSYSREELRTSSAHDAARAILAWEVRSSGSSEAMATLHLFGYETRLNYSHAIPEGFVDLCRWSEESHEVLSVMLPCSRRPLRWETIDASRDWANQLSTLQSDLDADEQFTFLVLSASEGSMSLPCLFSAASHGAAISLPQPAWPAAIKDIAVDSAACRVCGSTSCFTAEGVESSVFGCGQCNYVCHAACGGLPCPTHGESVLKFEAPACPHRHGKTAACYGMKKGEGCWQALLGPWPIQDPEDGIWEYHASTLAAAVARAARCIGRNLWVPFTEPYAKATLADALAANAGDLLCAIDGKRVRYRTAAFLADVMWYGHVATCDRTPDLGAIGHGGKMLAPVLCSDGFAKAFATLAPEDQYSTVRATCLIGSGVATTLLDLRAYDYIGYARTYLALKKLCSITHGSLDCYVARWFARGHPLIADSAKGPFADEAREMHASAAKILASSKVRRRALPATAMSTWTIDSAEPVYARDPVKVLMDIAGPAARIEDVTEAWASRMHWMADVPAQGSNVDVGIPCDPSVDLAVRFSLNFDEHSYMHTEVRTALRRAFSDAFAESAMQVFRSNQCAALPLVLDDIAWSTFRDRCVEHSEYGWFFMFMSIHGSSFRTQYSGPVDSVGSDLRPRLDPKVQRNVPWMGGWAQPRRLLEHTDATLVDLGHGEAKYLVSLAEATDKVVAFEIDLNAIRGAFSNVKPRGDPKFHFVPVSWVGYELSRVNSACIVAVAYRPGSVPPRMNHPRMHLLTADCDTAYGWLDIEGLQHTDKFITATGLKSGGAWRHHVSSETTVQGAVDSFQLKQAMEDATRCTKDD